MSSSTTVRKNRFFATKVEAIEFKKKHGGAMYSRAKHSKTKKGLLCGSVYTVRFV